MQRNEPEIQFDTYFGRVLAIARCALEISQEDLVGRTSIESDRLISIETGKVSATLSEVRVLSSALETQPSLLISMTEKLMTRWQPD